MFTLIKGAKVYAPEWLGKKDLLICADRIVAVEDEIEEKKLINDVKIIDASGCYIIPGFIDQHVHIVGGGGEGGFSTRTCEISINDLITSGITTVIGVLGTDGITRSLEGLYAKTRSLEEEGITAYMYSGSYALPISTLTGSIQRDLVLIDKVIGVGEIAISDHRSFVPSVDELSRIAAQTRNGGMLSGKCGIVHIHVGDGDDMLKVVIEVIKRTNIPATQFVVTHVNRNYKLLDDAIKFVSMGGIIDLTAGFYRNNDWKDCVPSYEALHYLLHKGVDINHITMSSDGNGSIPVFDTFGNLVSTKAASCKVLFDDFRSSIRDFGITIEKALLPITLNPASVLKLGRNKGSIQVGKHADIAVISDDLLTIRNVFALGICIYSMEQ